MGPVRAGHPKSRDRRVPAAPARGKTERARGRAAEPDRGRGGTGAIPPSRSERGKPPRGPKAEGRGPHGTRAPIVGVVMGSRSDLAVMRRTLALLDELAVPYEGRIVSAHRTPDWMAEYASAAEARGLEVIVAAAGGAAHLPGMVAAHTLLPVLGVPIAATLLAGMDALLSIVQMPGGVPVGTLAIGEPGAVNAAILAAQIVAGRHPEVRERLRRWRAARRDAVLASREL